MKKIFMGLTTLGMETVNVFDIRIDENKVYELSKPTPMIVSNFIGEFSFKIPEKFIVIEKEV